MFKWAVVLGGAGLAGGVTVLYLAFGAFLPWREEAEAERLAAIAGVAPGQTVAEIGAGTGRFTVSLARAVGPTGRVFSTELNPEHLQTIAARAKAAGLANVSTVAGLTTATNLPDACCDVLLMRNVYHHIQQPEQFVASIARALRPDSTVVILDFEPGALWLHGGAPDGSRRPGHGVSRADAIAEFRTAGFEPAHEIPHWSGPMWLVVLRRPR